MLPDSFDSPSRFSESSVRIAVSEAVSHDLLGPECCVVGWPGGVLRATVPKASIDEHDDSRTSENNIGPTAECWQNCLMCPVAHPACMK